MVYTKTIIYRLRCKTTAYTNIYVNHTTNIVKRRHNYRYMNGKSEIMTAIKQSGGFENWEMIVLEHYSDCKTKLDAEFKVFEWCEKIRKEEIPETRQNPALFLPNNAKNRQNPALFLPNNARNRQNPAVLTENGNIPSEILKTPHLQCEYCGKQFKRHDSVTRHIKLRCKILKKAQQSEEKLEKEQIIEKLKRELAEQNEQMMEEYKSRLEQFINKKCKMHPKTLEKINNNIMNQQNIGQQNNINNNSIQIVELGKENIGELFSRDQQMNVLGKRYGCLDYLIESVHFNDCYRQFQNIAITNIHNSLAHKYVDSEKRFITVNKDEMLKDIINFRMQDINEFYENCKDCGLDQLTSKSVGLFISDMDDDEKKENKIKDLRLAVYNLRKKLSPEFMRLLSLL